MSNQANSSEAKHTAGPWVVRYDFLCADGLKTIGIAADPIRAGSAAVAWPCGTTDAQLLANARLIAAAPDLLEALIAAEKALNNIRVCCQHTAWDATGPAVIAARAAIAKATGSAT